MSAKNHWQTDARLIQSVERDNFQHEIRLMQLRFNTRSVSHSEFYIEDWETHISQDLQWCYSTNKPPSSCVCAHWPPLDGWERVPRVPWCPSPAYGSAPEQHADERSLFSVTLCIELVLSMIFYIYVTLEHKSSLKSLGYIYSNSQKYIVWVKIINCSCMPKIISILRSWFMKIFCKCPTVNISKLNF